MTKSIETTTRQIVVRTRELFESEDDYLPKLLAAYVMCVCLLVVDVPELPDVFEFGAICPEEVQLAVLSTRAATVARTQVFRARDQLVTKTIENALT